jgi:hypothetical protein
MFATSHQLDHRGSARFVRPTAALAFFSACAVCSQMAFGAGPLTGTWKGTWEYNGQSGNVEIKVPDGEPSTSGHECVLKVSPAPKINGIPGPFRIVGKSDVHDTVVDFKGRINNDSNLAYIRVSLQSRGGVTADCVIDISSDASYELRLVLDKD